MNVWKYGDDINTDMLFPGKYTYSCSTADEIKPHLLEDLDPEFSDKVEAGDLIFAGKNFGCYSLSRSQSDRWYGSGLFLTNDKELIGGWFRTRDCPLSVILFLD